MISVGPTCQVPGCMCPPWKDRLCSGHWRLSHMFGHTPEPHQPDWHILPSTSPAFDRELSRQPMTQAMQMHEAIRQADWLLRYALDLEPTRTEHPGYRSHLTSAVVQSRAAIALLDLNERP